MEIETRFWLATHWKTRVAVVGVPVRRAHLAGPNSAKTPPGGKRGFLRGKRGIAADFGKGSKQKCVGLGSPRDAGADRYRAPRFGLSGSIGATGAAAALAKDCCRASSLPVKALIWPDNRFVSA